MKATDDETSLRMSAAADSCRERLPRAVLVLTARFVAEPRGPPKAMRQPHSIPACGWGLRRMER